MSAGSAVALESLLQTDSEPVRGYLEHLSKFGGKRLRPALVLLAGRMYGGITAQHESVAAIVEMIHLATLVHDDILDESAMRRGVDTVNRKVGNETAVLLGDYLFATAFREAARLEDRFPSEHLSDIVTIVCHGEMQQVFHRNDLEMTEKTYFEIIEGKTAVLYAAALRCGARLSGAPEDEAEALARFGLQFGSAFQIVDDILDLTGDEGVVGKSLGTDLDKAKMTLPLLRLRDKATAEDRAKLEDAIRSHDPKARMRVRPLLEKYGSIESARETADELVAQAREDLHRVPASADRDLLQQAAEFVLSRDR